MAEQVKHSAADSKTADQETNPDVKNSDVKLAKRPAITTYDARLIRQRPHLFPPEIIRDRDFRRMVLRDNFPLPADDYREGYHVGSDASYWLNGLRHPSPPRFSYQASMIARPISPCGAENIPIMGIMSQCFSAIAEVRGVFDYGILKNAVKTP